MSKQPPVCNVAGPVIFPGQKQSQFQPIPPVNPNDPYSIMRAIQVINNNFQILNRLGNFRDPNDPNNQSSFGIKSQAEVGNFTEKTRTKQTKRIYNPQDHEQYVDVEEITGLTFVDSKGGRTITWKQ
jgi:hypothetical protein